MDPILLAIPVFLGSVWFEMTIARRRRLATYERDDTLANFAMGIGNRILEAGWVLLQVVILGWFVDITPLDVGDGAAGWIVALVAVDIAFYWEHRMHHEMRVLWASHVVHHSSERYNLSVALRQPWLVFTTLPFLIPVALLGVPVELIAVSWALNLLYQFWIHTELIGKLWAPIELVFNTPSHHRVHHGSNRQYLDRNYAGVLIVWDRLFGTFEPEGEKVIYGLTKNINTHHPWRIATHELRGIAKNMRSTPRWRDKLGVLVHGPGWTPPGVAPVTAPALAS